MPVMKGWMPFSGQIVNWFGQGKCTFDWLGISQFIAVLSSHMLRMETNHLDHLQHDYYVDISYKFILE